MFDVGEVVICVKSGADAPNPWHRANPLTVGAEYTILRVVPCTKAMGTGLPDMFAVDRSGRLWNEENFRRKSKPTDIGFAYEILREAIGKVEA